MMNLNYTDVLNKVPAARRETAEIVHDTPSQFTRLRAARDGQPLYRAKYVRLLIGGNVVMTDAEFERETNKAVLIHVKGNVLIAGLGIGLILDPIIAKATKVTVIEKNTDVIALVGPSFPGCSIVHADIFDWTPPRGEKYDAIYFDIWPDICSDDLKEATRLHRKFARRLNAGGWMESWCRIANEALAWKR